MNTTIPDLVSNALAGFSIGSAIAQTVLNHPQVAIYWLCGAVAMILFKSFFHQ